MLNIYKSNRMELLFEALASVLYSTSSNPLKSDPLKPEWIGVQSRGMKQWITIQLAKKFGVCANFNFVFPKDVINSILSEFSDFKESDTIHTLDEDTLFWLILDQLFNLQASENFQNIETYIQNDVKGKKRFQLSAKIAKIFDDYQVYRPEVLLKWQNQNSSQSDKNNKNFWQSHLWNLIYEKQGGKHLASHILSFLNDVSTGTECKDTFPDRISFVGIFSLPPLFLQIIEKISQVVDIHLFLLVPSNQFFMDSASERQIQWISLQGTGNNSDALYFEMGNPLLTSLGTAGKEFLKTIETFNYHEPSVDLFQDPLDLSKTMLSYIQSDILNMVCRQKGQGESPVQINNDDTSISINACHSPIREAQVLKDLLLHQIKNDPDLCLHDIIVMMPDIETYAPFIESVFSTEQSLGYSISDRRKMSESSLFKAFFKILELNHERLEKTQILDLLLSEPIALKFKINTEEIDIIQDITTEANILWGRNAQHRKEKNLPAVFQNTWEFGLQRLFMGMSMPRSHVNPLNSVLPCPAIEGNALEILGKFSAFCSSLFSCLDLLKGNKTIDSWCRILNKITTSMIHPADEAAEDLKILTQAVNSLKKNADKAQFKSEISFDVIHSYLESKLDLNISQGSFLSGKITFCNLMPMRSIPFKIVVLMGMDEKSFPRKATNPGFDLIKTNPQTGDKNDRNEDRHLFLETLLSARSQFIITYTGMSVQDNSKLPCSGVVNELCDCMDQSFQFDKNFQYYYFHPLHPFHESNFNKPPFSFSKNNLKIAKALREKKTNKPLFFLPDFKNRKSQELSVISLDDFIVFFKNPLHYFFKNYLGLKFPETEIFSLEREPFKITGLDQYSLGQDLVEMEKATPAIHDPYPLVEGRGVLPFGNKGRLEFQRIVQIANPIAKAAKDLLGKNRHPSITGEIQLSELLLSFILSNIYDDGAYFINFGRLNGPRLLAGWINHLFLNAYAPVNYPKETILIGQDPDGKKTISTFKFEKIKANTAENIHLLAEYFLKGQQKPLYFFCNTSWQFANIIDKKNFDLSDANLNEAMQKSLDTWHGNRFKTGESTNRYISYLIENNDPFENFNALKSSGFIDNTLNVFKPMLKHLRRIK